jgi:hypothetical protein
MVIAFHGSFDHPRVGYPGMNIKTPIVRQVAWPMDIPE